MANGTAADAGVGGDRRSAALAFCVAVLRPFLMLLTRRDWHGGEQIPAAGGCVVALNHISEFDPLPAAHYVYDQGRLPRFLGKVEVFSVPLLGRLLRSAGQIPVYRHSPNAVRAFSAALAAVRGGRCIVIYPEGTITKEPGLWPMVGKTGAARIALTSGCPVIPVAQWGAHEVLGPYSRRPHPFPRKVMRIRAGAPVHLADLAAVTLTQEVLEVATERIMAAITSLLEQIRGEQAPARRFDPRAEGIADTGRPRPALDDDEGNVA